MNALDLGRSVSTKICEQCGNEFPRRRFYSHAQWAARRYCSRPCAGEARRSNRDPNERLEQTKPCKACGEPFHRLYRFSNAQWERAMYCNRSCRAKGQRHSREYEVRDCGYETPCWLSTYAASCHGYPRIPDPNGGRSYAHRVMYERHRGSIPPGMHLDHLCRVTRCCNPDHLEVVTPAENTRRGNAARLTSAQVIAIREMSGTTIAIGRQFGIDPSQVSRIRSGKTWRDVGRGESPEQILDGLDGPGLEEAA